jgi:hypothetical protein
VFAAGVTLGALALVAPFPTGHAAEPAGQAPAVAEIDPAQLPPPRRVVIPKLQGTLRFDGEFDEAVWSRAVELGPFVLSADGQPERERTTVRVWYDDNALHLGWTCTDTDIQATMTAHDSRFWLEEVLEFFVTPQDLTRYFELQWNPLGGTFDAIIANTLDGRGVSQEFTGDWTYTAPGMKSSVKVRGTAGKPGDTDESWQVEVAIPFADFGVAAPKPGDVWRGNFYRFSRGAGHPVEALAWTPTILRGFHQPGRFGELEFGK